MFKVWHVPSVEASSMPIGLLELKSINLLDYVILGDSKLQAPIKHRLDAKQQPEPNNYRLVRDLLLDFMTVVTVKQQKSNPRNVILALKVKRPKGKT